MGKDRSEEDLVDEARNAAIIEQEERIHREYPILVARVAELEEALRGTKTLLQLREDLFEVEKRRAQTFEHKLKLAEAEVVRLREAIRSVPPPPAPEPPRRTRPTPFTNGICRDCHERVLWGMTKNGKNIPLQTKPVIGEVIDWNRELEAELLTRGIACKRGYDEFGDQITVAVTENPDPLVARVVYPVHFQFCKARNLSGT